MKRRLPLILLLTLALSGCGYIYAKDEVAQMTSELARLSNQNATLVEELTQKDAEMIKLRDSVGLAGGAVLAPSAVTDPTQQLVLTDLPRQTALIPVTEDGTGLVYAISTAVFFGDNYVYVYAYGERMGVELILSYVVKNDGLNTVEWTPHLYQLGEGWLPMEKGQPVKSISPEDVNSTDATTEQSQPTSNAESQGGGSSDAASNAASQGSSSSEAVSNTAGVGIASSQVEFVQPADSAPAFPPLEEGIIPETTPLPPISSAAGEAGLRDAYLDILNRAK